MISSCRACLLQSEPKWQDLSTSFVTVAEGEYLTAYLPDGKIILVHHSGRVYETDESWTRREELVPIIDHGHM